VTASNLNKQKLLLTFLAIFASLFFGLISLMYVQLIGDHYLYLIAPILALVISLLFIFDRYAFFLVVVILRASLDASFNAIKVGSFGLGAILNALVILIALFTLLEKTTKSEVDLSRVKNAWWIYLSLGFVSIFYAVSFVLSLKVFLAYISYAAMFILGTYLVKSQKDYGKWMKAIVASSFIPVIYSFYSFVFGGRGVTFSVQEGFRLQSTFPHPNPFAPYLVLMISICFYLYKSKAEFISSKLLKLMPIYIFILIGLVVMTKTRSAWIATYLMFFVYALFNDRKFLLYVVAAPFLAILIPDIQTRIMDLTSGHDFGSTGYERLNSFAWRVKVWGDGIAFMDKTHYLFGYGVASFIPVSSQFVMANAFQKQDIDINAHSIFVQTFFELGFFGFIALINLMYSVVKTLTLNYYRDKLLVLMTVLLYGQLILQGVTDNLLDYLIVEWYTWFVIGLSFAKIGLTKAPSNIQLKLS
jgi:hypothetical protein